MKSGEGGVQFASGPIQKVGGGGGGGGGGCSSLQVRYEKWGGGGAVCFKSDTKSGGLCLAHSKYVIVNN